MPVTRLLEFRLTGTFEDPRWRPLNLNIADLLTGDTKPPQTTTAEMIAEWVAVKVREDLAAEGANLTFLEIEVEESVGQSATYSQRLD